MLKRTDAQHRVSQNNTSAFIEALSALQFDPLAQLAATLCQASIAFIGLLDRGDLWLGAKVGLSVERLLGTDRLCQYVTAQSTAFECELDAHMACGQLVEQSAVRCCAGAPIVYSDGLKQQHLGVVCVLDTKPLHLSAKHLEALTTVSDNVAMLVQLHQQNQALQQARREAEDAVRETVQRETELAKSNESLRQAKEVAEAASMAKSEFLANMSHELRTPLHGMVSFATLGLERVRTAKPERLGHYFSKIRGGGGELLMKLLNELLDLAKLEAGKMIFDFQLEDLGSLLATIADEFQSLMSERYIRMAYAPPPYPILAVVDAHRFMQVVRNLLSNAVKFSPESGKITMQLVSDESTVWVRICDQGPGIPAGELETIFDKFVQSSATKTGAGGTGLGLAICQQIMTAHRGRIWAETNPEGGAVFVCELPRAQEM